MRKNFLLFLLSVTAVSGQTKNFIDMPYIEVSAAVDTIITPDKIYLDIAIEEKDSKGKISVEEQENKMVAFLSSSGIDVKKQLTVSDAASKYKKYFLKQKDILKSKEYVLQLPDAKTVALVFEGLERIGISNVALQKTEYSGHEKLILELKAKAMAKAKNEAAVLTKTVNQKAGEVLFISSGITWNHRNEGKFAVGLDYDSGRVAGWQANDSYAPNDIDVEAIPYRASVNVKFKIIP